MASPLASAEAIARSQSVMVGASCAMTSDPMAALPPDCESLAAGDPRSHVQYKCDRHQDQCRAPCLTVPVIVRRDRIVEELDCQRCDRLVQSRLPILIVERGE